MISSELQSLIVIYEDIAENLILPFFFDTKIKRRR